MDYKKLTLNLLTKFPNLKPREVIKLNKYFVEYIRELAEKVGIDTIKEYKRTSKLIQKYKQKGYDCIGNVLVILDAYTEIAKTQTHYEDSETMIVNMVTPEEYEEFKCIIAMMESK